MSRGFSLVELLVGLAFLALFSLVVHQFCSALVRGVGLLEAASEAQETARLGVQLIAADVREAGFSPSGPLPDGIRQAGPQAFAMSRDLNGDGDVDDSNERVAYLYAADRHALLRAQGDASPQPLIDDLDEGGLSFTYLAADGAPLPATGDLDSDDRARIRRVAVHLAIAIPNPDPAGARLVRVEQSATATLRNRP